LKISGFPKELAAPIAMKAAQEFIAKNPGALDRIVFVEFSR
jgi:O-acetyl-ADP-ribose deacetylase (regulator of RNase III)